MLQNAKARKANLQRTKQEAAMKRYIQNITKRYRRAQKHINSELQVLKKTIGSQDFAMLKDICTVQVPEQRNEKGEVVQEASSYVNKQALLTEARNLIVLQREDRIKKGIRKRSTGRSSTRSAHSSAVAFLNKRNIDAAKENVTE